MGPKRCVAVLAALLLLAVSGCGAGAPPPPVPGAHIVVTLRADGSGRVDFWVGGGLRSDRELRDLGGRVAAVLFAGRTIRPTVVERGRAFPIGRTEVPRAYTPGSRPVVTVATDGVGPVTAAAGHPGYTLRIKCPWVRTTMGPRTRPPGAEYSWRVSPGARPLTAVIVMRPRPLHWASAMALLAVAAVALLMAFVSRQRRWRIVAGAGAVALGAVTTVLANDGTPGDALGVLGTLSGTPLAVATLAPLAALPLTVVAVIRLYWSACSRTARSATWPAVRSR